MEKTMKNVDKQVLNLDEMGMPTHATDGAAPAASPKRRRKAAVAKAEASAPSPAVEYPERITATINLLKLYELEATDADGTALCDEETGEIIVRRQCTLVLNTAIDGIVASKTDNTTQFSIGKTNTLGYSAYYLMEVAKLSNKRLRVFCTRMADKHKMFKFSRAAMQALFEDARIVVNRKFHKAGDIYITANGEAKTYQADGFAKDILDIDIPAENVDMFKEEVLADIV